MKELTQEQVNVLGEKARNIAGNAAESSLPLMLRDLGKQIAETGDSKMQAMFKFGFQLSDTGDYVMDMDVEWVRKIKHKDAFASERVNFDQPDLPGLDDAKPAAPKATPKQLNAAPLQLNAGTPDTPLCLCGHTAEMHDKKGCMQCTCELYEAAEAGKPMVTVETKTPPAAAKAEPQVDDSSDEACGSCALFGKDCPEKEDDPKAYSCVKFQRKPTVAQDGETPKFDTATYDQYAACAERGEDAELPYPGRVARNASKLLAAGILPVMVDSIDGKTLLRVMQVGAIKTNGIANLVCERRTCKTKASAERQYRALVERESRGAESAKCIDPSRPHIAGPITALYRERMGTDAGTIWTIGDDREYSGWHKAVEQVKQVWDERADALED